MGSRPSTATLTPQVRGVGIHIIVFAAYLLSACACLYLYFSLHTSPALIWVPVGVAIAAVVYGGYALLPTLFLAHVLALLLYSPAGLLPALVTGAGYAGEAALG